MTTNWPAYQSHKIVRAAPIVRISDDGEAVGMYLVVAGPDGEEPFRTTEPAMMMRATVGGYAVVYEPDDKHPDGYRSVSPKAAFEAGYRLVTG